MKFRRRSGRPGSRYWVSLAAVPALLAAVAAQTKKDTPPGTAAEGAGKAIRIAAAEEKGGQPPKDGTSVKMTKPGTFKISVRGAELRSVLQLLSLQHKVNIVATKEIQGSVTADLYDVTFDEALEAILHITGFAYRKKAGTYYVYTPEQLAAIIKAERKMVTRPFRLYYVTPKDAQDLIKPLLSSDGTLSTTPAAAVGIAESATDSGGNSYAINGVIIVRDYEDVVKKVAELIAEVDVKPEQVLIEATILRARLNETNSLGIDFTALAGIDFEGLSTTSDLASMTTGTLEGADAEGRAAAFRTDFSGAVPEGGMTIGFISNNIAMFVRALESVTDTTVLANPKLLIVNRQRGEVMVGNRSGYLTTTFTETTASQTVEFLETGTRLLVRPFIGKDGYVRLEIHPEDSSGSVETVGTSALPQETTTEVTTNVLVRDGRTIVIGGLFREDTSATRAQLPIVGNIPYLGTMFRSTSDTTVREEVIILITPRIIKQANDEAVSEHVKADIERLRIGAREGVRWWGRSRLAQVYCRKARQCYSMGDRCKALWYVDLTLSMNPRLVEAIRLKELLTERAYWSDRAEDTTAYHLIRRMIMQELGKPVDEVVPPDRPLDDNKIYPPARKAMGIQKRIGYPQIRVRRPRPPTTRRAPGKTRADAAPGAKTAPARRRRRPQAQPNVPPTPTRTIRTPVAKPPPLPTTRPVVRLKGPPGGQTEIKAWGKAADQDSGGTAPSISPPEAALTARSEEGK